MSFFKILPVFLWLKVKEAWIWVYLLALAVFIIPYYLGGYLWGMYEKGTFVEDSIWYWRLFVLGFELGLFGIGVLIYEVISLLVTWIKDNWSKAKKIVERR